MNLAVILSGRTGLDIPKQYVEIHGRPMIDFCLETFFAHPEVDAVQIVADRAWREYILGFVSQGERAKEQGEVSGIFRSRSQSAAVHLSRPHRSAGIRGGWRYGDDPRRSPALCEGGADFPLFQGYERA